MQCYGGSGRIVGTLMRMRVVLSISHDGSSRGCSPTTQYPVWYNPVIDKYFDRRKVISLGMTCL